MKKDGLALPPIPEYRHHLVFTLYYSNSLLLLMDAGHIKDPGYEKLLNISAIKEFTQRLHPVIDANESFSVTLNEIILLYTCFDMVNKVMVSDYDQVITDFTKDSEDPFDFKEVRDKILPVNVHLIKDTINKFGEYPEFAERRKLLEEMMV